MKTSLLFLLLFPAKLFAQQSILAQLQALPGITVTQTVDDHFTASYTIMLAQPIDHLGGGKGEFKQKIILGFNDIAAPVLMEIEGYALGQSIFPDYMKGCNHLQVEHRYFGSSVPDTLDWRYLSIQQAAYDLHRIRRLFGEIFTGKWMTKGISKGGQTALAYKMFFPSDVEATLLFVTPVKSSLNDPRFGDFFRAKAETPCGQKVFALQRSALKRKPELLPLLDAYVLENALSFSDMKLEVLFEYMALEYPFAFFQLCADCNQVPGPDSPPAQILNALVSAVPPRFFSDNFRPKLAPAFHMFYRELGYYEHDITPLKPWLSQDAYPNNIFAPATVAFDSTYLTSLNRWVRSPEASRLIFIYGENDPYTALQAPIDPRNDCLKLIAKNGCHSSRLENLSTEQRNNVFMKLSEWLEWKVE